MKGNVMLLKTPVQRTDSGPYTCVTFNRHGNQTAEMLMNVQYRPNCTIQRKEVNDEDTLVCTAIGNPEEVSFAWWRLSENDTEEVQNISPDGASSYLVLDFDFTVMRTYRCVANNSVGLGSYCEIDVAGKCWGAALCGCFIRGGYRSWSQLLIDRRELGMKKTFSKSSGKFANFNSSISCFRFLVNVFSALVIPPPFIQ